MLFQQTTHLFCIYIHGVRVYPPSVPSTLEQEVYREYLPEMVAEGVGLGPNALSR